MTNEITPDGVRELLPPRPVDGHKGTFGHVFVLAGSRGFTGAVKMACEAAGRAGAGLVTAGVPEALGDVIAASLLEPMSLMLPATPEETLAAFALEPALQFASGKNAVVLGPGLSQHQETRKFVLQFIQRCPIPLLVDADGLNCLSTDTAVLARREAPCVITPHPGEMARLTGRSTNEIQANREQSASEVASRFGCTVVLKGNRSIIANETGECWVNPTGNSGMATGGTGDILSGLIGGLIAQGISCFDASLLGVYLHGLAGDFAAREMTERALIAGDLLRFLPAAWRSLEEAP